MADGEGSLCLHYAGDNNQGATSILPTGTDAEVVEVPCSTLPHLLTAEEIASIRLVKIDVEGAEGVGAEAVAVAGGPDAALVIDWQVGWA